MKYSLITLTTIFLLLACNEDEPVDQTPKEETEETTDETETEEETEEEEEETEEPEQTPEANPIDLTDAFLSDFALNEAERESINIIDPILVDGVEETRGAISIVVPWDEDTEAYSLKEVNFDTEKFTIEPPIGQEMIVPDEPIAYTISALDSAELSIHYDVTVTKEEQPEVTQSDKYWLTVGGLEPYIVLESNGSISGDSIMIFVIPNGQFDRDMPVDVTGDYDLIRYKQEVQQLPYDIDNYSSAHTIPWRPITQYPIDFHYPRRTQFRVDKADWHTEVVVWVLPEHPLEEDGCELWVEIVEGIELPLPGQPCVPVQIAQDHSLPTGRWFDFKNVSNNPIQQISYELLQDGAVTSVKFAHEGVGGRYIGPGRTGRCLTTYAEKFTLGTYNQTGSIDLKFDYLYGVIVDEPYHFNDWVSPYTIDVFEYDFKFSVETEVVPVED